MHGICFTVVLVLIVLVFIIVCMVNCTGLEFHRAITAARQSKEETTTK